ncbi:caprin-2 isoform X8 [Coturnix japonica]|uniref:caprin-2 isoform X8 n=1 Tax=Coturnix japonica TaxID=93934 RepID=UPI000777992B|nr:caprin-2 isoform X8 [Coturnix japonica]
MPDADREGRGRRGACPDRGFRVLRCRSEEGEEKSMKTAKQQVTPAGDGQPSGSPLQAALNSAASPSQAYETYIDNGLICLKHKIRNIEKKKLKLEDYKDRLKKGEALNQDQLEAVEKYDEVVHNLEFAKELQKTFSGLSQDLLKAQKKAQRRESLLKLEAEKKKLRTILQVQYVLQNFTQEHVQKDFKGGVNGAIYLPSKELDYLIRFAKLTCPERNESLSVEDQMEQSSLYFWDLLEGSEKPVVGTTYKHMKDLLSKLLDSGYFESIPTPRTTVPVKELEDVHRKSERTRQMSKGEPVKETESLVELMKSEIQPQEVPKSVHQPAAEFCSTSTLPKDPVLRREKLQDLMTQIQGTYNFMQESILDFDKASPSAIGSSQPPSVTPASSPVASKEQKLPSHSDFLQQPLRATESSMTLHGSSTSLASAEQTLSGSETEDLVTPQAAQASASLSQETEKYASQPLYQTSPHISEPLIPKKIEVAQATVPVPSEPQSPLPTSSASITPVPQGQSFQSPPVSSSSVTITAAPFQAMQTVFKVNAPLPPRKDQEVKEDSSYSAGYNQSFSTASTQTLPQSQLQSSHVAEQTSLSQESLSSAVNYQPDGAVSVSNGSLAFYPAQTNVIPRPPQPYLNSRGSVRGSARGGRSLANSYRSPGGYKAGFDAYRGSPSITNGTYGQLQFPARDYAGMPYSQRDVNYQQCYKRGGIASGPRANSRAGWSDSSQVSSPERDNETFNSGDSGQGDSRSITPVDMPVTSQAATILPVHVYPLPQQMRVAFSAARTSNLAPGTLDQPIVFDLLLNNLGETFDIQLGRFNCPVNGTYVFIFHMLKLAVNVPLYVNLMKNEEVLVSAYANDGAPDHETASNHAVLQLFQGDQIWLRLHRGAIYGSSWKYSTFSGYLLYQD